MIFNYKPVFNNKYENFNKCFELVNNVMSLSKGSVAEISFQDCDSIGMGSCVLLGGLCVDMKLRGVKVILLEKTMSKKVRDKFELFSVIETIKYPDLFVPEVIPKYRVFPMRTKLDNELILKWTQMIFLEWLSANKVLRSVEESDLVSKIWELFHNSFDHSGSLSGVHSCAESVVIKGKRFLRMIITDFGKGISYNVRESLGYPKAPAIVCLTFALREGFTTRHSNIGGVGLKLLKDFIQSNDCILEIFNENAILRVSIEGEVDYKTIDESFSGTIVHMFVPIK